MPEPTEHVDTPNFGKTMTVGMLMQELTKHAPDLPIVTEGCDCYGSAFRTTEWSSGTELFVLIEREPLKPWPGEGTIDRTIVPPLQNPDLL